MAENEEPQNNERNDVQDATGIQGWLITLVAFVRLCVTFRPMFVRAAAYVRSRRNKHVHRPELGASDNQQSDSNSRVDSGHYLAGENPQTQGESGYTPEQLNNEQRQQRLS